MEITIKPTDEVFDMAGTVVRLWEGHCDLGYEVTALICCDICAFSEADGPTPIPPPSIDWSERVRAAMSELWQIAYALTDQDAEMVLTVAQKLIAEGMEEHARGFAAGVEGGNGRGDRARDQEAPVRLPAAGGDQET